MFAAREVCIEHPLFASAKTSRRRWSTADDRLGLRQQCFWQIEKAPLTKTAYIGIRLQKAAGGVVSR
jgi:hypothetical protein